MKKRLLSLVLSAVMAVSAVSLTAVTNEKSAETAYAADSIVAFPGAEGGGKYATGGRGGTVYHVTNLNDSGTGSFRDAVSSSKRIVVFDVGGTIELKSDVVVKSNITIAGQTAPGGHGVTLKNYKVGLGGSNIIMRYISSRPGERGSSAEYDALGGSDGSNSIIDHCAFGWANDEQWGLYSNNDMYTTQWTIIGPANSFSYHSKGIHGFGIMFGKSNNTWHHNLVVHNISRNFRGKVEGTSTAEFVNNVIYDWGYQTAYGTLGHLNYVGNYLKKGTYTTGNRYINKSSGSNYEKMKFYLTGNKLVDKNNDIVIAEGDDWTGSNGFDEATYGSSTAFEITYNSENIAYTPDAETADEAYAHVTSFVGPAVDADSRTEIDAEVINDTINGTGTLSGARPLSEASSSQLEEIEKYGITCGVTYNYPETTYASDYGDLYTDTDGDGMPDWWELERGLDPYSASTAETNGDYCGQGYTNIEYYLNDLTVNSFPEGTVTTSPKVGSEVTVDPNADGSDSSVVATVAEAIAYVEAAAAEGVSGTKTIYITDGEYDDDLEINIDNVVVQLAEGSTDVIVPSITINGSSCSVTGINSYYVVVNGDEAVFSDLFTGSVELLTSGTRSYFSGCEIKGNIVSDKAQAVFEGCTFSRNDTLAEVTGSSADAYTIEFKDCTITAASIASGTGLAAVYGGTASVSGTWFDGVTGVVCGVTGDSSATVLSETEFLNAYYGPYNFTKGSDGWNPGGWDTLTPQESLAALADSITLSSMISKDTEVVTSFDSDPDVTVKWSSNNSERFSNNTILIGDYGEGAVTITLTVTLSKTGLTDEVRTFTVTVGSKTETTDGVYTFDSFSVGDTSAEFYDANAGNGDSIEGYVVDNIDGVTFSDHDKFYMINQSATTGSTIHDFTYYFADEGITDQVYETSYDVYITDISTDGYCEAYVRGSQTVGQLRFLEDGGEYAIKNYVNGSADTELVTVGSQWYTVKVVVDAVGLSSGTEPTVNYYLYDSDGELVTSAKNCQIGSKYFGTDGYTNDMFAANRIVFRPNRNYDTVKFYVDNLSYTNLTELAEEDAAIISEDTSLTMTSGDSLPVYGSHMTTVTWSAVDGTSGIVNSDGTINYSAFATATVKVKGVVSAGDDLVGTAETSVITLSLTGTGSGTVEAADPSFENTDDYSDWNIQKDQTEVVDLANTSDIGGNSTAKIELSNKAVFKVLDTSVGTGTVTFTADIYKVKGSDNTTGRSFRIYLENAETAASGGVATEEFSSENIIYHLMDVNDEVYSVISDAPSANAAVDTDLGITLNDAGWYRVVVTVDVDNKTAATSIYSHSSDGSYNPDAAFDTPLTSTTTSLISKSPMQIKQIRLVRTASSTVYFDNVSLAVGSEETEDPDEPTDPTEPDEPAYDEAYDINGDGSVDMDDADEILQYTLNKYAVSAGFDATKADVNGDGVITALDASILAQYVLDNQ
ncbi:MAG: dockerin type I domain-containing protein [Eubacterium sp.]|nr:dockerin type I domain-containing protein [Eubacterium sp.]